ncbi:efflux RND transporter periplasmic adaptor subunit [Agitococcus lubricus]|uniref:RND family efflux transporter MFP subunit n=1 Tax=Agitococcus lubricus TaxID=1077255 RepID=A0A2T5IX54_9GAMM|nr:efflux RND transporter periplasmic adaptor subunit [Agitococcus lubricus]PTQ88430.1 RND family efflux transporter MFP subunit [Agitococcus lubricus]
MKPYFIHVLAIIGGALVVTGCGQAPQATVAQVKEVASLELAATDVTKAEIQTVQSNVAITGQLQALNFTTVQTEVGAAVAEVLVREGQTVTKGQILVRLATQDLEARVHQAEAALAAANAESVLANAVQQRNEELHQQRYVSDIDYKRGIAEANAKAENVKAQKALLLIAKKALANATITAPMTGIVAKRYVQTGQTVAMNAPLLDVIDLRELELVATVPAEHVAQLTIGQRVDFTIQGFTDTFNATVSRINPVADSATRAVTFYARVNQQGQLLKAGLFAQGRLQLGQAEQGVVVPTVAIHYQQQQPYVWRVQGKQLQQQAVTLGTTDSRQGKTVVKQGLAAGDMIVLVQLTEQAANMPVKLAE